MELEDKSQLLHKQPEWRKFIVINGPPDSGKDTAANFIVSFIRRNAAHLCPMHIKFSEPLKKSAHALFDVFHNWDYYDSKEGRSQKNLANGDFLGLSPREAYIAMHQKILDEMFGPEALGFIMRKRIVRHNSVQVFISSDGGFVDELEPIINLLGQRSVLLIELHAVGKTFEGDNRNYCGEEAKKRWPKITLVRLPNTIGSADDKDLFRILCEGTAKKFLQIEEKDE
jgi:hypothetical protein